MAQFLRSRFVWGFVAGAVVSPLALFAILLIVLQIARMRYPETIQPPILPNMAADYAWGVVDPNGEEIPFASFKDKVVFLSNIKPGCDKCIAELPFLEALYQQIKDEDIAFVVVAISGDQDQILDLIAEHNLSFPVYRPTTDRPEMFKLNLPASFVIARDGSVVYRSGTGARYDDRTFVDYLKGLVYAGNMAPEAETGTPE